MKSLWLTRILCSMAAACVVTLTSADTTSLGTDFMERDPAKADYNQVGMPIQEGAQALTFSNQDFGMQGPVRVSGTYSSTFGYELEASYARLLNANNAISLLGAHASDENRIDATFAHAWDAHQRSKVSIERLAEQLDFSYDSGDTSEWVAQYAFGVGYQYVFDQGLIHDLEFSGYYAQAESKDLDTIRYTGTDGLLYDNYRHIAGATSQGLELSTDVLPWATGLFGVGLNYDKITYDTKYEDTDAKNDSGLGFTLSLQQILSKHTKLAISASQREVYDSYSTSLSVLTPSDIEVGLTAETTLGRDSSPNDNRLSLAVAYYIDDHSRYAVGYHLSDQADRSGLESWASQSLAHMNMVLAAADQQSVQVAAGFVEDYADNSPESDEPTITLYAGSINTVNISAYVDELGFNAEQLAQAPRITGGPAGVTFIYDEKNKTLLTEQAVPEEDIEQAAKPILMIFPVVGNDRAYLTFRTRVMEGSNTPYPNNPSPEGVDGLQTSYNLPSGTAVNLVFYAQGVENPSLPPQPSNVLYINPSQAYNYVYVNGKYTSYFTPVDDHNCYRVDTSVDNKVVLTSTVSSVCPDPATITVKGCNQTKCGDVITLNISTTSGPTASGGAISPAQTNNPYSYTFTSNQLSPGQDSTYDATNTKIAKVLVNDVDVTETSTFYLDVQPSTVMINSDAVPASFSGQTVQVYLHVTNSKGQTADNQAPFTIAVQSPPDIPASIDMRDATVDVSYNYSFVHEGGVTYGSSDFDSKISSVAMKLVVDGTERDVTDLGLSTTVSAKDVVTTGLYNPKYAGNSVHVYMNLCNLDGLCANNNTAPATMDLIANSVQTPSVNGGSDIDGTDTSEIYSPAYSFSSAQVSPGAGRSYNMSSNDTFIKVADANGKDVTDLVHVVASNNGATLVMQTDGDAVSATIPTGTYNVYVHILNDANQAASNCTDTTCETLSGTPFHMLVTNTAPLNNGGTIATTAVVGQPFAGYTFDTTTQVNPGADHQPGYDMSGTHIISITDSQGRSIPIADMGLTLASEGTSLTLVSDGVVADSIAAGNYSITMQVMNTKQETTTNTNAYVLTVGASPTIQGSIDLRTATVGVPYNYDFIANHVVTSGSSDFNANASSSILKMVNSDHTETEVLPSDLGLAVTITATDVVLSGTLNAGYSDKTLHVYLNLTNMDGLSANNNAAPAILNLDSNPAQVPTVGSGPVAATDTSVLYPGYDFNSSVSAGSNRSYANLNNKNGGTFVRVMDQAGNDVSSSVHVTLPSSVSSGASLTLISDGAAVAAGLSGTYNVYLHVLNDDGQTNSNCPDTDASCSGATITGGAPFTMQITNTAPLNNGGTISTTAAVGQSFTGYTFNTSTQVNPGADYQPGYEMSGTYITKITDSQGNSVSIADMGLTLAGTSDSTALHLVSNGIVASTIAPGNYNITMQVMNTKQESTINTTSYILQVNAAPTTAYLNCPPAMDPDGTLNDAIEGKSSTIWSPVTTATYTGDITPANTLAEQEFLGQAKAQPTSGTFFYSAVISGNTLTCKYGLGSEPNVKYVATTTLPNGAVPIDQGGSTWVGGGCYTHETTGRSEVNNNECKIQLSDYTQ